MIDKARWVRMALINCIDANRELMNVAAYLSTEEYANGCDDEIYNLSLEVLDLAGRCDEIEEKLRKIWSSKED